METALTHTTDTAPNPALPPGAVLPAHLDPFGIHILEEWLASGEEFHWFADEAVYYEGDWGAFLETFNSCDADLLATNVRSYEKDPNWNWWPSLRAPGTDNPLENGVAVLLPLMRFSRRAAEAVLQGVRDGWTGHVEALIPTLVSRANLKIEDIGGTGDFTPSGRNCRWYDQRTWKCRRPIEHVPGLFHFPVPVAEQTLAPARLEVAASESPPATRPKRILYVSPVGAGAAQLLPPTLGIFLEAGADCLLLQYDEADLEIPEEVRVIRDKGTKWELGHRHLRPEITDPYDFVFFWDDDLSTEGFDPARFVRLMALNRLAMAQPAITSPHGLSHGITRRVPCPPPLRGPDGITCTPVVGRMTNFVEIMAPVFTREAWREFYSYVVPENRSGWGYDYIPLGRKGIVDEMSVIHTRPVQSACHEAKADMAVFLESQGIHSYSLQEMGLLLDAPRREESP